MVKYLKLRDMISEKKGFLLDIEGTLITHIENGRVYPDALKFYEFLLNKNKKVSLITNIARLSTRRVSAILNKMGMRISPELIINPTIAAVKGVLEKEIKKPIRIFLISEGGHYEDLIC